MGRAYLRDPSEQCTGKRSASSCFLSAMTHVGANICTGGLLLHQSMGAEGKGVGSWKGGEAPAREVPGRADMVQCGVPRAGPEDTEAQAGMGLKLENPLQKGSALSVWSHQVAARMFALAPCI